MVKVAAIKCPTCKEWANEEEIIDDHCVKCEEETQVDYDEDDYRDDEFDYHDMIDEGNNICDDWGNLYTLDQWKKDREVIEHG